MAEFCITVACSCIRLTHLVQWHTGNWGRFFNTRCKMQEKKRKPTAKQLFFCRAKKLTWQRKKHVQCAQHSLNENCCTMYKYFCICFSFFYGWFSKQEPPHLDKFTCLLLIFFFSIFVAFILFVHNFLLVSLSRLSERICKLMLWKKHTHTVFKRNYKAQVFCICWSTNDNFNFKIKLLL